MMVVTLYCTMDFLLIDAVRFVNLSTRHVLIARGNGSTIGMKCVLQTELLTAFICVYIVASLIRYWHTASAGDTARCGIREIIKYKSRFAVMTPRDSGFPPALELHLQI